MSTAGLLLHPIRLRIVQAFIGGRALTTRALSAELTDVPAASLYRHVARLVDAGVLVTAAEQRLRGALERTYILRPTSATGFNKVILESAEADCRELTAFIAWLLGKFQCDSASGNLDAMRDKVWYDAVELWLDDAESAELLRDLARVLQARLENPGAPSRKIYILGSILLSEGEAAS